MHPTNFRFIWLHSVSEEKNVKKSTNQKQEMSVAIIFVNGSGRNEQSKQRTFHRCFLPSFVSFGQTVSEEKNLKKSVNQKQALPVPAMFINGLGRNEQSLWRTFHRWFLPSFSSFGWGVLEAYLSVIQFRDNCILNTIFKLELSPF